MVDFETSAAAFNAIGAGVVALSVDRAEDSAALAERLSLKKVKLLAEVDGPTVAKQTGAQLAEAGFLQAAGFILDPDGAVQASVIASGPLGRFQPLDVIRKVASAKS